MRIIDVQTFEGMPFDEYLSLPGLSFSGIKGDGVKFEPTEKMRFGSLVDAYLFEPHTYNGEKFNLVRPAAKAVKDVLGPLLANGKRQLVVTCKMIYRGLFIVYKGRVDLFASDIVIDMKVSELDIIKAIAHFRYDNQVSGYALPLGAKVSVIISVHPKKCTIQKQAIPTSAEWWKHKILEYGKPFMG